MTKLYLVPIVSIFRWISDPSHWMVDDEEVPIICGNLTGARHCPPQYTCLCVGPNPNHGYTNFDNFLWSMLTTFQLITLDYWENVYNMVSSTHIICSFYVFVRNCNALLLTTVEVCKFQ